MPTTLRPGSYTIRYMLDIPQVEPTGLTTLRAAQIAAYAAQPRFGTLVGNAVQPSDAEFILNRIADDNITGVIRLQTQRDITKEDLGNAIVAAFRAQGHPQVAAHLSASEYTPASAIFTPLVAVAAAPLALASSVAGNQRMALRDRFGTVIVGAEPRIRNDARPPSGSTIAGSALAAASRRISADPARSGTIGASAAAEAARAASEAFAIPTWLIVALSAAGVAVAGVVVYAGYRRISGR